MSTFNRLAAIKCGIPEYMLGGLQRWIEDGIEPGDFLCAVLQNDLAAAVGNADDTNVKLLPNYVKFLFNYVSSGAWGSVARFESWRDSFLPYDEPETLARVQSTGLDAIYRALDKKND